MAWYWQVPVCWECTRCGTIDYGSRWWFWKSPPDACDHCGTTAFTGVGTHSRPLSWSLPARGVRANWYAGVFGWYVMAVGVLGLIQVGVVFSGVTAVTLDPMYPQMYYSPVLILGLGLGYLIRRGVIVAWALGVIGVVSGFLLGLRVLVLTPAWWSAVVVLWWLAGVTVAWKSAYILRR